MGVLLVSIDGREALGLGLTGLFRCPHAQLRAAQSGPYII